MLLYRHSTECPAAIQMFLDQNPRYWRFVPMSDEEASRPEQTIHTSNHRLESHRRTGSSQNRIVHSKFAHASAELSIFNKAISFTICLFQISPQSRFAQSSS